MHLDEERLQRLIDGELPAADQAAAREHLNACEQCRRAQAAALSEEHRVEALLRELDQPAPAVDLVVLEPRSSAGRWVAAAALVAALAGAAFAIPGSPLPRWVRQVLLGEHHEARPRVPVFENPAGISVTPGSRLVIDFLSRQSAGTASVRITDSPELTIQAPNGAATFTSDVDRVAVNNHGSASFEIEVPRVAAWVEIRVEGVPSFRKQGARVTLGRETARDAYAVPLTPP